MLTICDRLGALLLICAACQPLLAAGPLGPWQDLGPLPAGLSNQAFTVAGDHIYTIDGGGGTWHAPLGPGGVPGNWTPTGSALNENRFEMKLIAGGNAIYTVGGNLGGVATRTTVEYATINPDGSLDPWVMTSPLNTRRASAGVTVYNEYIYAGGGWEGNWTWPTSVEYAHINPDGSVGPWQQTSPMLRQRIYPGFASVDGFLYMIAGARHTYGTETVERVAIQPDGSLGAWVFDESIPEPRGSPAVVHEETIYLVGGGGVPWGEPQLVSVLYASVQPDHTLTGWAETSPLVSSGPWSVASGTGDWIYSTSATGIQMAVVPEPATLSLLGLGSLVALRRRRR